MFFLGCDGGSTKTELLLVEDSGRILAHKFFEGCSYAFLGGEGLRRLMMESCRQVLSESSISSRELTSAMFGVTGYGESPEIATVFHSVLKDALPECRDIIVDNDSVVGWAGSLAARPGINIVAGTGSIAYGRDGKHNGCRVGGWSLLFADEGSCSWVARQLIAEFVKQADGRRPHSLLYDELRKEIGITNDLYCSGYLDKDLRQDSALLAQLQLVALRAARRGDLVAADIYHRAAKELVEMAVAVRNSLEFPAELPVKVSYSGGLFRAEEVIMDAFRAEISAHGFVLTEPVYSPVLGAVALAAEKYLSSEGLGEMLSHVAREI